MFLLIMKSICLFVHVGFIKFNQYIGMNIYNNIDEINNQEKIKSQKEIKATSLRGPRKER